jgi:hypothetical protein
VPELEWDTLCSKEVAVGYSLRGVDREIGLNDNIEGCAMEIKLSTKIAEQDLGQEAIVREPTDEELHDVPEKAPEIAEYAGGSCWLTFTGFYVVPGVGLAGIFGAIPPT